MANTSDYDWFGSWSEFNLSGGSQSIIVAGPEDTTITTLPTAYDPDLETISESEWFIRHIGRVSMAVGEVVSEATTPVNWVLRYVEDLRILDDQEVTEIRDNEVYGSDNILAHGISVISVNSAGITQHQAMPIAWDIESVKPADDHAGVILTLSNPGSNSISFTTQTRTLTRG